METAQDYPEADEGAAVSQIMIDIADEYFEDLENDAFDSAKFDPATHESMANDIWEDLTKAVGDPDPLSRHQSWLKTKERSIHLASAINGGIVNHKWVHSNIGHQWKGRQQAWKKAQRKTKRVSQRTSPQKKPETTQSDYTGTSFAAMIQKFIPNRSTGLESLEGVEIALTDFQPHVVELPRFEDLATSLVDQLLDPSFQIHRDLNYQAWISRFGGRDFFINLMIKSIRTELQAFQGNPISCQVLAHILGSQGLLRDWSPNGGYLLYITSSKNSEYWRPYVGQAHIRQRRIAQHNSAAECGRQDRLVYWIATKPERELNYLRLWDLPEELEGHDQGKDLFSNIMEHLMCLAFKTLPSAQLKMYLGPGDHSTRGLNVLSPLLQGVYVSTHVRSTARQSLTLSNDPEIVQFSSIRLDQLRGEERHKSLPSDKRPVKQDIEKAFNDAIDPRFKGKFSGTTPVPEEMRQSQNTVSEEFATPFGSQNALIGFVFDLDEDIYLDTAEEEKDIPSWLPRSIFKIGFDSSNCLVWPFNGGKTSDMRQYRVQPADPVLCGLNRGIIESSGLRVIILCGKSAEKVAVNSSFQRIKIRINNISTDGFLETKSGKIIRVYLNTGVPLSAMSQRAHRPSRKMCQAIKLATCLTQTQKIQPYLLKSRIAVGEIVLLRLREKTENITLTEESIPDVCWAWLYDHRFQEEDFGLIKAMGGSIVKGILLAIVTAPKCPDEFKSAPREQVVPRARGYKEPDEKFTKLQLTAMRELHERKTGGGEAQPLQTDEALESPGGGMKSTRLEPKRRSPSSKGKTPQAETPTKSKGSTAKKEKEPATRLSGHKPKPKVTNEKPPKGSSRSTMSSSQSTIAPQIIANEEECDQPAGQRSSIESSTSSVTQRAALEEDGDLLTSDEIQRALQNVELDPLVLRSLKLEPPEEPVLLINLLEMKVSKRSKGARTVARMPHELRGKVPMCWWCGESNHGFTKTGKTTYPSWNETLSELLCSSCAIHTHKEGYLPIVKCQILHFEICCATCGSRVGPLWEFDSSSEQLTCGPSCRASSKGLSQNKPRQAGRDEVSGTYQEQMPNKLSMSPAIRKYFKKKYEFDTTIPAIQARRSAFLEKL